jgi:enolase-phosphatase E1
VKADIGAVVLDIEGTTTPIAFVYDVLFPFARQRLRAYLLEPAHRNALREPLRRLRVEWTADMNDRSSEGGEGLPRVDARQGDDDLESIAAYVTWLMDQDRKSPGLKLLQGQIWEEGYRRGELRGEVFADVAPALQRWRDAGVPVAIYSSGSELAQRLLFGSTASGDLTPLLARFFDTTVGAKQSAESYRRIALELGIPPNGMMFISDATTELDAAHAAGCQVLLCVRPGNRPSPAHEYATIHSFADIP